ARELLFALRPNLCHTAQAIIREYDIGCHRLLIGDLLAQCAKMLEQPQVLRGQIRHARHFLCFLLTYGYERGGNLDGALSANNLSREPVEPENGITIISDLTQQFLLNERT